MDIETQGLGAGSYPEPKEEKLKSVNAKVYISFELEYDVPENWDREQIANDIKENINDLTWYDEKIEEIELW